jgi:hypothetical protein
MKKNKKAIAKTTSDIQVDPIPDILILPDPDRDKRAAKIAQRLEAIPQAFRATYRKAVEGGSLRAAINSQCGECLGWSVREIRQCSDSACPLFSVRPYQQIPQNGRRGRFIVPESRKNTRRA